MKRRSPQDSYIVNGKFRLPKIPPNCFGFAVSYIVTSEDVERLRAAGVEDIEIGDSNGETWVGGICNKPKKSRRATPRQYDSSMDNCTITSAPPHIFNRDIGKNIANPERLEALKDYYASQRKIDAAGNEYYDGEEIIDGDTIRDKSPFDIDIVEAIFSNRRLLDRVIRESEKDKTE